MSRSTWRQPRRSAVARCARPLIGAAASAGLGAGQAPVPQPAAGDAGSTFNDSHFHLTNYVQEGIGARDFLRIMGTRVGRSTLFGIPLQQQWSYGNSGDFAPTYYLHTDAPLYYYSFTDAAIAVAYSSPDEGRAGPLRPDDHRVQPGRHVRRRSHPPGAAGLPRRLHRHRRVQHPQGIRLGQDRRRNRQSHQPGARPHARVRRRLGPGGDPPQRHRHAVRQGGRRAGLPGPDQGAAAAPSQGVDHLGPHRPGPHRPAGAGVGRRRRASPHPPGHPRGDAHRRLARPT